MFNKLWNDPVWSKVIATAIVGVVMLLGTYVLNLWPTINHLLKPTEDKSLSNSGRSGSEESNSKSQKPVEPPTPKPKQPDSTQSPPLKQPRKEKESGMRSQAVPAVPPLPQVQVKQPEVQKPELSEQEDKKGTASPSPPPDEPLASRLAKVCQQPVVGLNRRPQAFLPIWFEILLRLKDTKFEVDRTLQNLYKIKDRIRDAGYSTPEDFFRESLYTLRCLEDVDEVKLENLGTTEKYLDKPFENQRIVFRSP